MYEEHPRVCFRLTELGLLLAREPCLPFGNSGLKNRRRPFGPLSQSLNLTLVKYNLWVLSHAYWQGAAVGLVKAASEHNGEAYCFGFPQSFPRYFCIIEILHSGGVLRSILRSFTVYESLSSMPFGPGSFASLIVQASGEPDSTTTAVSGAEATVPSNVEDITAFVSA